MVQFLDIFLTNENITEESLQLIAVTALMVALKIHDTQQFPISFLVEFMWDEENLSPEDNAKQMEDAKRFLLKFEYKLMKVLMD
jgi:hypothetical protein